MKPIEAHDQVALGPRKGLELALVSMSYRLFRSGVTVAIVGLAVAFLVHMVTHGILSQATQRSVQLELSKDRALGEIITRLSKPDTRTAIREALVRGAPERLAELARFAGTNLEAVAAHRATAQELHRLGDEVAKLPRAAQAALLSDAAPAEWLDQLDAAGLERAERRANELGVRLSSSFAAARQGLLERRAELDEFSGRVERGHRAAVLGLERAYPGQSAFGLVVAPPPGLVETLNTLGFGLGGKPLAELGAYARREAQLERLGKALLDSGLRAAVARRARIAPEAVSVETLLDEVRALDEARWLAGAVEEADGSGEIDERALLALLEHARRERRLSAVAGETPSEGTVLGLSERNQWLIALSFLVCVVGVANAMLMSVTERFTEIATMKCLGAMDGFIMMLFLFEAIVQGVVGGAIGVVVGVALAFLRGFAEFGGLFVEGFAAGASLPLGISCSFGVGVLLSALAAVGPSFLAARLAPMEAMRVD